jgi:hypothetical protein
LLGFDPFAKERQEENDTGDEVSLTGPSNAEECQPGLPRYNNDLLNIEQNCLYSPSNSAFDNGIYVQLVIGKESKTVRPKFIYRMGNGGTPQIAMDGKPFFLDMTDTQENPNLKAYIGLDFGTSNTSISYVNQHAIQTYDKRATEKFWLELNDLVQLLPYPLSAPLARHLCQVEPSAIVKTAREFAESALALAAYTTYIEMCAKKQQRTTRLLRGFTQRSIGPLWKFLQDNLNELGKDSLITSQFKEFLDDSKFQEIDKAVTFFGQHKHEKESDAAFNPRVVQLIANICYKVFSRYRFGHFEHIRQERFKHGVYTGLFRIAVGSNPLAFIDSHPYRGSVPFPNGGEAFIVDLEKSFALPMQPLVFWYQCEKHPDEEHCYLFDKPLERSEPFKTFSYKAVGYACSCIISSDHQDLSLLAEMLRTNFQQDPKLQIISYES